MDHVTADIRERWETVTVPRSLELLEQAKRGEQIDKWELRTLLYDRGRFRRLSSFGHQVEQLHHKSTIEVLAFERRLAVWMVLWGWRFQRQRRHMKTLETAVEVLNASLEFHDALAFLARRCYRPTQRELQRYRATGRYRDPQQRPALHSCLKIACLEAMTDPDGRRIGLMARKTPLGPARIELMAGQSYFVVLWWAAIAEVVPVSLLSKKEPLRGPESTFNVALSA